MQEEKYKFYYNQLTHLVREYEGVVSKLQATIKPLLRPHLEVGQCVQQRVQDVCSSTCSCPPLCSCPTLLQASTLDCLPLPRLPPC